MAIAQFDAEITVEAAPWSESLGSWAGTLWQKVVDNLITTLAGAIVLLITGLLVRFRNRI